MRFIQEFGYTVKSGMEWEYQAWLQDNEAALAASYPDGTKYLGNFATIVSSERASGSYKLYIELDSYAALDRLAALGHDASSDFVRLYREAYRLDQAHDAPGSRGLYKAVVDATVFDQPD
jgi:hypothetical protein